MDLGCLDMCCVERQSTEFSPDKENSTSSCNSIDSLTATYKIGKNKATKESGLSNFSTLNKCTSQIRKPPRRKTSPLNWFPRKKVDSYLKRKIRLLQEVDGMNSTLDETLGDSNPHYSKVLKEKIAVREAATKAMEARKAAMVEASWCKILHAARIECKDAEAQLLEAEKSAADAFEAATSIGVILYDIADCPLKFYKIETSAAAGGGSTHTVSASFETAFEVDKQVAYAVKVAFTKLANCPSINKDEFRELLRKISQNPDSEENPQELFELSSDCESDFETGLNENGCSSLNYNHKNLSGLRQMNFLKRQASEKFNTTHLVEMMLERLKGLHEDELASLATIVATCGLNAALAEGGCHKKNEQDLNLHETGSVRNSGIESGQTRRGMTETELPGLDKFLVKRLTRLEREVLEAKNARKNETKDDDQQKLDKSSHENPHPFENESSDLGTMLVKHSSKLEKDIAEARRKNETVYGTNSRKLSRRVNTEAEMPSLDKFLVKHVSRLEKEVQEAKKKSNFDTDEGTKVAKNKKTNSATPDARTEEISVHCEDAPMGKENIDHNKTGDGEVVMKKRGFVQEGSSQTLLQDISSDHKIECLTGEAITEEAEALPVEDENHESKEEESTYENTRDLSLRSNSRSQKQYMKCGGNGTISSESLDNVLVKRVSRLEKEKMKLHATQEVVMKAKQRKETAKEADKGSEECLDQILVKPKTRLEREKMAAVQGEMRHSLTRREAREKELQETWGGLSLGNSIKPHISKLERAKASSEDRIRHSSVHKEAREKELQEAWGGLSLGNSIKPHISKLEREKASSEDQTRPSSIRKGAREKELQDAWGGLSLGNSIRPHVSRLERDKAAWLKAEEEERRRAMEQS